MMLCNVRNTFYLFFLLCTVCQSVCSQEYSVNIKKLSTEEGLSNRFTRNVIKDSNGFVWIATKNGLNRYDGYTFKQYTTATSNLSNNDITEIAEDGQQRIWIFQYENALNKVDILDIQTDRIQSMNDVFGNNIPFKVNNISWIQANPSGQIFIRTRGYELYKFANNKFTRIYRIPKKLDLHIFKIDDQYIWLTSVMRRNNPKFTPIVIQLNLQGTFLKEYVLPAQSRLLAITTNNELWVIKQGNPTVMQQYTKDTVSFIFKNHLDIPKRMYGFKSYERSAFSPYDDSFWWFHQGEKGSDFFLINKKEETTVDLLEYLRPYLSYPSSKIIAIRFLSKNQVWLATEDGVHIVYIKKKKFTTLLTDPQNNGSIRGIIEDANGVLHANSYGKRFRISADRSSTTIIPKSSWLSVAKDTDGGIWYGAYGNKGVNKYDPATKKNSNFTSNATRIRNVNSLYFDTSNTLWIGTEMGLFFKDQHTSNIQKFNQYNEFDILGSSRINHIYKAPEGLWLLSSTGLYVLHKDRGIIKRYSTTQDVPNKIPYDNLLHLHIDKKGIFWLSTNNGGLIKFNPTDGAFKQFTTEDNLSSNTIYCAYEDDDHRLWLPSEFGLMLFDKKTESVQTFFKEDGIAHNEFNTYSHYRDKDGVFYFGGLAGITVVNPKDFSIASTLKSPLRLTSCKILNGETGKLRELTTTPQSSTAIKLSPDDISLNLSFSLLNYSNSAKNSYAYKVEGLDKKWTPITQNSIRLNNLPYGNYTIYIKGKDERGVASINQIMLPIAVIVPFYKSNWFMISCFLVFGIIVYSVFKIRESQLKRSQIRLEHTVKERTEEVVAQKEKIEQQALQLKELDSVKSRFFANISHELRTPLTLILGPLHGMLSKLPSYEKKDIPKMQSTMQTMQRNGKSLLHLIEEILDISKLEAHKMELEERPIAFFVFCKRIFSSFESMAKSRHISYTLLYTLSEDIMVLIDDQKVEKILINLISNAFKYSEDYSTITLKIDEDPAEIRMSVTDTGLGIHPDDLPHVFDRFYQSKQVNAPAYGGTGIGLALCKELAALMNGTIEVESTFEKGSTFTFIFPKKETTDITVPETTYADHNESNVEEIVPNPMDTPYKNDREKSTVLVVEDHEDMRNFIVETLQENYHVQTAHHGEDALKILKESATLPDMIISDVMMPTMDGFTLLQRIKSKSSWKMIPVILLTARATENDLLTALEIGVNDYVTKPFNPPELLARIQNLLRNYKERKAWLEKETIKETIKETHIAPSVVQEESWDTAWIQQAKEIATRELQNPDYKVPDMAAEMNVSETQLLVKMKQITGFTPKEFLREIRLQQARTLLESKAKRTIAEVSYATGFNTPGYFSTVYKKRFGKSPASYFE